jgi:hypothetical protein
MNKHRINTATKTVVIQNVKNRPNNEKQIDVLKIAFDAAKTLKITKEQMCLGWDIWTKCIWSN